MTDELNSGTAMTMQEGNTQSTIGIPIYPAMEPGLRLVCLRCDHAWLRRSLAKMPGTCPRCCTPYWNRTRRGQESPTPKARLPPPHPTFSRQSDPLTRTQGLQVASDVIWALRGYRKNPDYRTIQRDLNFICEVLQRASEGETNNLTRPGSY